MTSNTARHNEARQKGKHSDKKFSDFIVAYQNEEEANLPLRCSSPGEENYENNGAISPIRRASTRNARSSMPDTHLPVHYAPNIDNAALAAATNDANELHRMVHARLCMDDIEGASHYMHLALAVAPHRADLWEHAGLIAATRRDLVLAEACFHRSLTLAGDTATLHRNLADCLRQSARLAEARYHYTRALEIEPQLLHAVRALALISAKLGDIGDAANYWLRARELDPSSLNDAINLVAALAKAGRVEELLCTVRHLRSQFAANAAALEALSYVLYQHDFFGEALSVARQGLAVDPQRAGLHHYAASALSICGQIDESLAHSIEAARLLPEDPFMQYHLAVLQLMTGDYKDGWTRHKAYYALPDKQRRLFFPSFREWNGEPVKGSRFLLVSDQGHGDEIQCLRFAVWLHEQGAVVDLLTSEWVAPLAASLRGVRCVLTKPPSGPYEFWSHLLRMPEYMQLVVSNLPSVRIPYLLAPSDKVDRWRTRIKNCSRHNTRTVSRRVGIVWSGDPTFMLDRFRSIPLSKFVACFEEPGLTWLALQKGAKEREAERLADAFQIHTLGPDINDFVDTLAILETLDLLITVDTSVAHLAGAAGRPVWVLVPAYAEWRWLRNRDDSPWYPSMRLFRQRKLGNWDPVIEEVTKALRLWRDACIPPAGT